uniref:Uncharacterized protein n=1 Tax=Takifugu rubripes TaxID=31033 RepID=A0A3B5K4B0_TAKRU
NVPRLLPPPFITTSPGSPLGAYLQTELSQPGPRSLEKTSNPINSLTDDLVVHDLERTRAIPKVIFKKTNKSMLKKHGDNTVFLITPSPSPRLRACSTDFPPSLLPCSQN